VGRAGTLERTGTPAGSTLDPAATSGGRASSVPEPALAVLGAAAWLGATVVDGLSDWSAGYARLADRGAARAALLLPAAHATRLPGEPTVHLDWDVRDALDELQERGEEIVAYAELYRWRLWRRGRRMITGPLAGLADSALRGLAPITHPRRPGDLGSMPAPDDRPQNEPDSARAREAG
jgi:hypothetical protein